VSTLSDTVKSYKVLLIIRNNGADSVKVSEILFMGKQPDLISDAHLIAIGTQDQFPLVEVFEQPGFKLGSASTRQFASTQIQSLQDEEGIVKQVRSPWNDERIVLVLSGQNAVGLDRMRELLDQDPLFYQLEGDTVLISANDPDADVYDPDAYIITFLREARQKNFPSSSSR
jgi:hypothetical protein